MKKNSVHFVLIFLTLGTIFVLGIRYSKQKEFNEREEAEWYVRNLDYEFCAVVKDIEVLKQRWGYGYIICDLADTKAFNVLKEDSLNNFLTYNESLRFIVRQEKRSVKLLVQGISTIKLEDSLCVKS